MDRGVYKLNLLKKWQTHPTFHAALLSPYNKTEEHGPNYPQPPPDILEQGELYKIEAIVRHQKKHNGEVLYKVRWKGYSPMDDTMEPEGNFAGTGEQILVLYKKAHHL